MHIYGGGLGEEQMRVRPLTALAAIAAVTLVLAGCDEARLAAKAQTKLSSKSTPGAPDHQPQLVQLLLDTPGAPGAPEAPPSAASGGLQTRIQQATEQAAASIRGSHSKISRMEHGRVGFKAVNTPGVANRSTCALGASSTGASRDVAASTLAA